MIKKTIIKKKVPVARVDRVNFVNIDDVPAVEPVMTSMFPINTHPTMVLFYSGASCSFVSQKFVHKHGVGTTVLPS